ncbi:hypothetical protein AB0M44_46635 [Streptosporangium subroseum]|uniref:hypothetical protein n=1 Tax=Streptosporangium subroseum TaxID=106412 RepID=UPI00341DEF4E
MLAGWNPELRWVLKSQEEPRLWQQQDGIEVGDIAAGPTAIIDAQGRVSITYALVAVTLSGRLPVIRQTIFTSLPRLNGTRANSSITSARGRRARHQQPDPEPPVTPQPHDYPRM